MFGYYKNTLSILTQTNGKLHFIFLIFLIFSSTILDANLLFILSDISSLGDISLVDVFFILLRFFLLLFGLYASIMFSFGIFKKLSENLFQILLKNYSEDHRLLGKDLFVKIVGIDSLMVARGYILQIVYFITDVLTIFFMSIALFFTLPKEAIIYLVLLAVSFALLQWVLLQISRRQGEVRSKFDEVRLNVARETYQLKDFLYVIDNYKLVKNRYIASLVKFNRSLKINTFIVQSSKLQLEVLLALTIFVYIIFSVTSGASLELSSLLTMGFALMRVIPAFSRASSSIQQIAFSQAAVLEIVNVLSMKNCNSRRVKVEFTKPIVLEVMSNKLTKKFKFELAPSKTYAVVGESGSGKTTFIRSLLGLSTDFKFESSNKTLNILSNFRISYVSQDVNLLSGDLLTNLLLSDEFTNEDERRANQILKELSLDKLDLDMSYGEDLAELSGGERQRLSIARALLSKPDILVLDEFTSALDPDSTKKVFKLCSDLVHTIIYITHDEELSKFADEIINFDKLRKS